MKLRKFLLCAVLTVCLSSLLTLFVFAEDGYYDDQTPIKFNQSHLESITTNETNGRAEFLQYMFDGDTYDVGLYSNGNSWFGQNGDYILITFNQDTPISKIVFYLTGNWTKASLIATNSAGDIVINMDGKSDATTVIAQSDNSNGGESKPVTVFKKELEDPYLMVKEIKLTPFEIKWSSPKTFKVAEIEIEGIHIHNHNIKTDNIVKEPTCALEGIREYSCCCGDIAGLPEPATGEHTMTEQLVYRNGYTNPGYKALVCATCDTKDGDATAEVGPLFTSLGYSAREDGSGAIQFGFLANSKNIQRFTALTGNPVLFGVVAGSRETLAQGNPLVVDEYGLSVANNFIVRRDLSSSGYDIISYQISNLGQSFLDTELILAGYIYIGGKVSYLGEENTNDIVTVSYNGIMRK